MPPASPARPSVTTTPIASIFRRIGCWFDSHRADTYATDSPSRQATDWIRVVPFIGMHLMCLGVFVAGWSWSAVGIAGALYAVRMFAITGFYHRYFSHRAFATSRPAQFVFALLGASAAQRGPLWWAAHHRHHHRHADTRQDLHSPHEHGFWWAHMGWITAPSNFPTDLSAVPDLARPS